MTAQSFFHTLGTAFKGSQWRIFSLLAAGAFFLSVFVGAFSRVSLRVLLFRGVVWGLVMALVFKGVWVVIEKVLPELLSEQVPGSAVNEVLPEESPPPRFWEDQESAETNSEEREVNLEKATATNEPIPPQGALAMQLEGQDPIKMAQVVREALQKDKKKRE